MGGRARRQQNRLMKEANDLTAQQMAENRELQREMIAKYEARQADYEAMEFFNPYENMQNYYADLQNAYVGMENTYEDLGVSTVAAQFQMEQGQQQRADIMSALSGAAGGSGIGALAQSLANQGVLQSRQVAVDLAQQQRQNMMMSAQQQQQIDQMQRATDMQIQQAIAQGAASADMAERGGMSMLQGAEIGRQSTLLGMSAGDYAGANAGVQQAYANQMGAIGMGMNAMSSRMGMWGQIIGGVAGAAGSIGAAKMPMMCIPQGINIDTLDGSIAIENIKPGDFIMGYFGNPVKVLQKHEYLEDPSKERFYKVKFNDGSVVDVCDMHKIKDVRAKDITEDVMSKEIYGGVEFSYDLVTEDIGYRMNGVPVNSMVQEMAELAVQLKINKYGKNRI